MKQTPQSSLPDAKPNARIGILGGSFDPPHLGHQLLAFSFYAVEPLDQLWIIPCDNHPFDKKMQAFAHRFAMCELAFSSINPNIRVLPLESELPPPNRTLHTLQAIKKIRSDVSLMMALGSDLIEQFPTWYKPDQIVAICQPVLFERQGFPLGPLPVELKQAIIHRGLQLPNVQSSKLRKEMASNDFSSLNSLLDRRVRDYILDHKLYV